MLDAVRGQTRSIERALPPTARYCVREVDMRRSDAVPCLPELPAPCDINILLFEAQIKHRAASPAAYDALELEVRFCVRGVISPLLANVYLHYVLDLWAQQWRQRHATGDMIIVRFADDCVLGFEHEAEARRFLEEMRLRLAEFSLSLHPEKTKLIEFGRLAATKRERRGQAKPETFTFLGFVLICGRSHRGTFLIHRRTRGDRMRGTLKRVKEEMRRRMHQPIPDQGRWLRQVVTGYFAYHAVPTNAHALGAFRHHVSEIWMRTLSRRSQKTHLTWDRMAKLVADWLPRVRIQHPWPNQRFDVKHPR